MIKIEFENLKLQLISSEDLEQLRIWRNSPHVSMQMEHQELITEKDHLHWYESLNKSNNLYFKILVSAIPIGIVNLKNIDWNRHEAEAGVFVGREDFIGTISPIVAIFIFTKTMFNCFGFEKLRAKIAKENINALQFNKELGYRFFENVNEKFDKYVCTKNAFNSPHSSFSKIRDLFRGNSAIRVYFDKGYPSALKDINNEHSIFEVFYL